MTKPTVSEVIAWVAQLTVPEQDEVLQQLLRQRGQTAPEGVDTAWVNRFNALIVHIPVQEAPSVRREDWYSDDGR